LWSKDPQREGRQIISCGVKILRERGGRSLVVE